MNAKNLSWAVFLIVLGLILVLRNFGIIDFYLNWMMLWRFWPLILIYIGLTTLMENTSLKRFAWILPVLLLLFLVYVVNEGPGKRYSFNKGSKHSDGWERSEDSLHKQHFFQEMEPEIRKADFDFEGGGAEFILKDTTSYLIDVYSVSHKQNYTLEKVLKDSTVHLDMRMNSRSMNLDSRLRTNKTEIRLNALPIWDIEMNVGAGTCDFDFTPYRLKSLEMNAGAANIDVKLKDNYAKTKVSIEAGAASVTVRIPKESSCILDIDAVLSSKDFPGFSKREDGKYYSQHYNAAANQILIDIDAGVSEINILSY